MTLPRLFIWGLGNAGLGLALAARERRLPLAGCFNRGAARAAEAAQALDRPVHHSGTQARALQELQQADLVIVATRDDAVSLVGGALRGAHLLPHTCVAHLSGCLPAAALGVVGVPRGSMHPLAACPPPTMAARRLVGARFVLEGDAAALEPMRRFVTQGLCGQSTTLSAAAKARYHAACVMAANLTLALVDLAAQEADAAGLDAASEAMVSLCRQALDGAAQGGLLQSLTGPAVRGDGTTVRGHLAVLTGPAAEAYRLLSSHALGMAAGRGLDAARCAELRHVLQDAMP